MTEKAHTKREKEQRAGPKLVMPSPRYYRLVTHIVRNIAGQPGPMICIVYGPPGEGKTTGISFAAQSTGTEVFAPHPGLFESDKAGHPARLFRNIYGEAAEVIRGQHPKLCKGGKKKPAAIVIEDADKVLGRFPDTHYTVNGQHLCGLMQALCDDPSRVFRRPMPRIPLLLSCNDLTVLPESIRRHGRADLISWRLSHEERVQIVSGMYPLISPDDIENLVLSHASEPIAFFVELRRRWIDRQSQSFFREIKPRQALQLALDGKWKVTVPEPKAADLCLLAQEMQLCTSPLSDEEEQG